MFVHGVPDTHRVWSDVLDHLHRDDVLTPDLPGFGDEPGPGEPTKEAYVEWLVGQLEAVGEPVDLVGHDWGSILVVRAATTRPDLIRTLAFGGGPIDETYAWHDIARLWQTPEVGEQVMTGITPETMGPGLEAVGLTAGQAAVAAAHVDDEMKRCILGLYRSAIHVGDEWGPGLDGFARPAARPLGRRRRVRTSGVRSAHGRAPRRRRRRLRRGGTGGRAATRPRSPPSGSTRLWATAQ